MRLWTECDSTKRQRRLHSELPLPLPRPRSLLPSNHCVNIYPKGKSKIKHCLAAFFPSLSHSLPPLSVSPSVNRLFASNICAAFRLMQTLNVSMLQQQHLQHMQHWLWLCHIVWIIQLRNLFQFGLPQVAQDSKSKSNPNSHSNCLMWLQAINVFASQLLITLREIGRGLLEIIGNYWICSRNILLNFITIISVWIKLLNALRDS